LPIFAVITTDRGTVTSAITASNGEITTSITSTPSAVIVAVTIWLIVCCRPAATFSMSLVTRDSTSPWG
jgi:hypothetical protein